VRVTGEITERMLLYLDTEGDLADICVQDSFAYLADGHNGMLVVDVSDPSAPFQVSRLHTFGSAEGIVVSEEFVYISVSGAGLQVVDISNPHEPKSIGEMRAEGAALDVVKSGEYAFIAAHDTGVTVAPAQCEFAAFYVNPEGTGEYATIAEAIDIAESGDVIYLANGTYTGPGNRDLNYVGKAISLSSLNEDPDSCIIDCQGSDSEPHRGFIFQSGETSESVIEGITIMGGYADEGGAIKCENGSSPTIRNCTLRDNYGTSGGAIYCDSSTPSIENCTISYNASPIAGAAFLLYSDPNFDRCILSHSIEGSAVFGYESFPLLSCSDIVWNEGGDWVGCIAEQQNQNGNFSNTPAFCDPDSGDFRLQPGSPCLPEHNDCEVLVGALGEGDCAPTGAEEVPISERVALSAYPNPFNPHLTITFTLPRSKEGSLVVHDVSGRQIRLLIEGQFTRGINEIIWNGQDEHAQEVASGVYFVRLVADEFEKSKKVVLLR